MKKYNEQQVQQITDLIATTRRDLDKPSRQKIMNMITIDAHSRDMVIGIIENGETSKSAQVDVTAAHRWDADIDNSVIKICDASFPVTSTSETAVVSSSRRLLIAFTSPLRRRAGCPWAPGPAGTRKTELQGSLAQRKIDVRVQLLTGVDYRTMGDIFKGLAASGSWGCFDEFNRLVPEVLSVCSVQYKCVGCAERKANMPGRGLEFVDKDGVKHDAIKFIAADGVEMPLEEGCSGFITMNPELHQSG